MVKDTVEVTGFGMAASLGMDAVNACAAARAGITKTSTLKVLNFAGSIPFGREKRGGVLPVVGHTSPIPQGFTAKARLAMLGAAALQDLTHTAGLDAAEVTASGLYLNLSDKFLEQADQADRNKAGEPESFAFPSGNWRATAEEVLEMALTRACLRLPLEKRHLYFAGHAGFAVALEQASEHTRSGAVERAIVGALDSCIEPAFLQAAASMRVLKTGDNPVGFLPGESAAFVLLERMGSPHSDRKAAARITALGFGQEPLHQFADKPAAGHGLTSAIRAALRSLPGGVPTFVVGDLNGLERRALDWGHAILRLHREFDVGDWPLWLPAVSFGECGAASGALATCLTARAMERGYAPGPRALIFLASDCGSRACLILEQAE